MPRIASYPLNILFGVRGVKVLHSEPFIPTNFRIFFPSACTPLAVPRSECHTLNFRIPFPSACIHLAVPRSGGKVHSKDDPKNQGFFKQCEGCVTATSSPSATCLSAEAPSPQWPLPCPREHARLQTYPRRKPAIQQKDSKGSLFRTVSDETWMREPRKNSRESPCSRPPRACST
jgi:hypothetical protein